MKPESREENIQAHSARMAEDRKHWGPGPWEFEKSNREEFEHLGLPCIVQRGGSGAWCGYVGISPGHPLHGKSYGGRYEGEEYVPSPVSDLRVHGGITYASECAGSICHIPKPGEAEDVWWLGFDCAHYQDRTPGLADLGGDIYWDLDLVKAETRRLAEQLKG